MAQCGGGVSMFEMTKEQRLALMKEQEKLAQSAFKNSLVSCTITNHRNGFGTRHPNNHMNPREMIQAEFNEILRSIELQKDTVRADKERLERNEAELAELNARAERFSAWLRTN